MGPQQRSHRVGIANCGPSFLNSFGLFILPRHHLEMLGPGFHCLLSPKWLWWDLQRKPPAMVGLRWGRITEVDHPQVWEKVSGYTCVSDRYDQGVEVGGGV